MAVQPPLTPLPELQDSSPLGGKPPKSPSRMLRFMLLLGIPALGTAFYFDEDVIRWVRANPSSTLHFLAELVSRLLDWPPVLAFLGGVYFAVRRWGPRDYRRWVGTAFVGAALCGASGTLLRSTIGRARPSAAIEQGWYGPRYNGHWTFGRHDYAAFPSGHTSTVAGAAGVLLLARRRWGFMALAITTIVAASRIYLLAHRLSDVMAAAFLGLVGGAWIWHRWGRPSGS